MVFPRVPKRNESMLKDLAVLPQCSRRGQITLLTEPTSFLPPVADPGSFTSCQGGPDYPPDGADELPASLWLAQAVLPHAKEGQLTLLTEPNDLQAPGYRPRQFYLM